MKAKTYFGVTGQQVSIGPNGVLKIEGQHRGATDAFIQLHDASVAPADGVVPLKSWYVGAGSDAAPTPFFQSFLASELECATGVYVCVSSTDGAKTLSANLMDLSVELQREDPYLGGNVGGDLVTPRISLGVAVNKRVRKLEYLSSDIDAGQLYIQLHDSLAPAAGALPLVSLPLPQNTFAPAIVATFGRGILLDGNGAFFVSSTPAIYTAAVVNVCMRAISN